MSPIDLRRPSALDALAVAELVRRCPPLDMNSLYCNLLQCSHFADCAVVADCCGKLVGSVTGYRLPEQPDVLFIWQVAVLELARLLHGHPGAEALPLSQLVAQRGAGGIIDPETHHTVLPALIARVEGGAFRLLHRRAGVAGDPYLTRGTSSVIAPQLRVVS